MPELIEQMYCSQQIVIPPKYPYILKRYCKAAIKTQPYDLLRWSFEYFKALAERRAPPVKLRLEYPVYSTEGGLTRGCLKVLANQLAGMSVIPTTVVKKAWQGFCLDPIELRRILCLCEVYLRADSVLFLHFIAVAGGFLTKNLTHTMILLCETLTKEPDGGSAAIPLQDFLLMYKFLAKINASKDYKYINGFREGFQPPEEEEVEEEQSHHEEVMSITASDEFWEDSECDLHKLAITDDLVAKSTNISQKVHRPLIGRIERSPSAERDCAIEREKFKKDRKGKLTQAEDPVQSKTETEADAAKDTKEVVDTEEKRDGIEINVFDEDDNPVKIEFYGEADEDETGEGGGDADDAYAAQSVKSGLTSIKSDMASVIAYKATVPEKVDPEKQKIVEYVKECYEIREERREELEETFREISDIVDRFKSANYDLGMVAGRQMSTTSGEFIVQTIEREIMAYIDDQIAILPDPDLKKKKAKPEEVAMIRDLLVQFLDDNMDVICPELEEVEEEEEAIPDVVMVYAVPGIGDTVDEEIVQEFVEYATEVAKIQADVFMPRNIRHFMCPPLEKFLDYKYEIKKEEVPTGGLITD